MYSGIFFQYHVCYKMYNSSYTVLPSFLYKFNVQIYGGVWFVIDQINYDYLDKSLV